MRITAHKHERPLFDPSDYSPEVIPWPLKYINSIGPFNAAQCR